MRELLEENGNWFSKLGLLIVIQCHTYVIYDYVCLISLMLGHYFKMFL